MGKAILRDGKKIDYKDYIENDPYWQKVRAARFEFDEGKCIVCHTDLHNRKFEMHHLSYMRLGNEHIRDVVTMCPECHAAFHRNWTKNMFWKGREEGHWDAFDLEHTARLCNAYYSDDMFISKNEDAPNLCSENTCRLYIDKYCKDFGISPPPMIDPNDIQLFVRNKRYELLFDAIQTGKTVDEFLDATYGEKIRGKNPVRRDAETYFKRHTVASFQKHYKENENINRLMKEVWVLKRKGGITNE